MHHFLSKFHVAKPFLALQNHYLYKLYIINFVNAVVRLWGGHTSPYKFEKFRIEKEQNIAATLFVR